MGYRQSAVSYRSHRSHGHIVVLRENGRRLWGLAQKAFRHLVANVISEIAGHDQSIIDDYLRFCKGAAISLHARCAGRMRRISQNDPNTRVAQFEQVRGDSLPCCNFVHGQHDAPVHRAVRCYASIRQSVLVEHCQQFVLVAGGRRKDYTVQSSAHEQPSEFCWAIGHIPKRQDDEAVTRFLEPSERTVLEFNHIAGARSLICQSDEKATPGNKALGGYIRMIIQGRRRGLHALARLGAYVRSIV